MPQQVVILTFQDPSGQPLAGGSVTLRLNTDAVSLNDDIQIVAGRVIKANLNDTGSVAINIYPNDQLTPVGTIYFVIAYTAQGQPVWRGELTFATVATDFLTQEDGGLIDLGDGVSFLLWE